MAKYRERIADQLLKDELEGAGAVLIEGPKWCGKTTTAEQQSKSVVYMNDPAVEKELLSVVDTNIKLILKGATPRLIDEWQTAPALWDAIRFEVDHRDKCRAVYFDWLGCSCPYRKNPSFRCRTF